jgi:hypothetical protein
MRCRQDSDCLLWVRDWMLQVNSIGSHLHLAGDIAAWLTFGATSFMTLIIGYLGRAHQSNQAQPNTDGLPARAVRLIGLLASLAAVMTAFSSLAIAKSQDYFNRANAIRVMIFTTGHRFWTRRMQTRPRQCWMIWQTSSPDEPLRQVTDDCFFVSGGMPAKCAIVSRHRILRSGRVDGGPSHPPPQSDSRPGTWSLRPSQIGTWMEPISGRDFDACLRSDVSRSLETRRHDQLSAMPLCRRADCPGQRVAEGTDRHGIGAVAD